MPLTILIIGGGRLGAALAILLSGDHHSVVILEEDATRAEELRALVPAASVVSGDVTDPGLLESVGVRAADAVAAVTRDDAANLLVASLSKFEFGVPRTIGRIVDPSNAWLYTPEMGVDVALNQAELIAKLVAEELSLGEMTTLAKLRRGRFALVEERVHPLSTASGHSIADLDLPVECVLVGVIRSEELMPATGALVLQAGDEILAVVHADAATALHERLRPR